jgi:hypothetical protein
MIDLTVMIIIDMTAALGVTKFRPIGNARNLR